MKDVNANKRVIVEKILDNPTYDQESRLICDLRKTLRDMPLWKLENLKLVIELKLMRAVETNTHSVSVEWFPDAANTTCLPIG